MHIRNLTVVLCTLTLLAGSPNDASEWPAATPPQIVEARMQEKKVLPPTSEETAKIEAAAPDKASAPPAQPRRVLVYGRLWTHLPTPFAAAAVRILGKKTGAFESVITDDPGELLPQRLATYDAVVLNNLHERDPFLPTDFGRLPKDQQDAARELDEQVKQGLLDYVKGGKGVAGVHASNCALQNWPAYGDLMGGYFGGYILQDLAIQTEDTGHPVVACFEGKTFKIHDEIYIFEGPYTRRNLRILLRLNHDEMQFPQKISLPHKGLEQGRPDKDHAISWVRAYGQGRVFYTTLGHCPETYWNPLFLRHLLGGIQFAIGDLKGETAPSAP